LQFTDGSDTNILNSWHYSYTGSVSETDATSVATDVLNGWETYVSSYCTTNFATESCEVTDLSSNTGAQAVVSVTHAGTNAGTKMPSSTCMVLKATIALRYRGGHPRVYLTGFPESYLTSANSWSTAAQGSVFTAWTNILASVTSSPPADLGTVAQVAVSYYSGFTAVQNPITGRWRNVPKLRTTPEVYTIESWATNPKVASQRRRNQQSG
jgi:hypothetical protein